MSIAVMFMKLYRYYCQSTDEYVGEKNIYPSEVISLVKELMYLNMYMYIMYVYCLHSGAKDPVDRVCRGKQQ